MTLSLYMDHHVDGRITKGLRRRGIDVLTALEDNAHQLPDALLLDRATELRRVLVSQDSHLVIEAVRRQKEGLSFAGLIYGFQLSGSVGKTVADLETICAVFDPAEFEGRIEYLPIQ